MRFLAAIVGLLFTGWVASAQSIPMPGPGSAGTEIVTSFIGTKSDTSGCTTCTFTAQNVGTAGSVSIIAIAYKMNAGDTAVSSVTVCGTSATLAVQVHPSDETTAIYAVVDPGSTSCTVVVTFAGASLGGALAYYRTERQSSVTATDTGSCHVTSGATCTTGSLSTGISAGGNLIAALAANTGVTNTWSASAGSMTTDSANVNVSSRTQTFGHMDSAAGQSAFTVTATSSGWSNSTDGAVASFR